MQTRSLHLKTLFKMGRLSIYFSLFSLVTILFVVNVSFRAKRFKEIDSIIEKRLEHTPLIAEASNYPLILKSLKNSLQIDEIGLFRVDCSPLATSSWNINNNFCLNDKNDRIKKIITFKAEQIVVVYELGFSSLELLGSNAELIASCFICFFILSFGGIYSFTWLSFIRPIKEIESALISNNRPKKGFLELGLIYEKLLGFKELIKKAENEKIRFELARTVVHDIRNPLESLRLNLENDKSIDQKISLQFNEIGHHIDKLLGKNEDFCKPLNLSLLANSIREDSAVKYAGVNLETSGFVGSFRSKCSFFDLKNILSNMIRNSVEAEASSIEIKILNHNQLLTIRLKDNGVGVSPVNITSIFQREFSTKVEGHGIGLSGIKEYLKSINGSIELEGSDFGSSFVLQIPIEKDDEYVLIDDDKFIRLGWELAAQKNGAKFKSFSKIEEFLANASSFSSESLIFVDSNLGDGIKGEITGKEIFNQGFTNIFLATSYTDFDLSLYPYIKGLCSKSPPF